MPGLRITIGGVIAIGALVIGISAVYGGWNGVSFAGTVASFFGLAVSIPTLLAVQQIRRRYLRQRIFEDHVKRLKTLCRKLDASCAGKDAGECRKSLARLGSVFANLRIHAKGKDAVELIEGQIAELDRVGPELICLRAAELSPSIHASVEAIEIEILEIEWGRDDS